MSKHYQPYEPSDASAPAANSEMPPYPGRIAVPPPSSSASPAPSGGSADKLKWIAVAAAFIVLLVAVSMVFLVTWLSRKAERSDIASASSPTLAAQVNKGEGYSSSLFDDMHSDGNRSEGGANDPLRAFDLGDALATDETGTGAARADNRIRDNRRGADKAPEPHPVASTRTRDDVLTDGMVRSDVRFNSDARPAPRALGPVAGARTTPSEVPIIHEQPSDINDKTALNIYQPGMGIPLKRNETKPEPRPAAPQPQAPDTIRNDQGVLALPQGYTGQVAGQQQPQQLPGGGYALPPQSNMNSGGYQQQPAQPQMNGGYAQQPAPFNPQAWNGQPQYQQQPQMAQQQPGGWPQQQPTTAPAQQYQQQPMPQYQTPPMNNGGYAAQPQPQYQSQQPMQPQYNNGYAGQPNPMTQQQLPPAAQLDPYANAAGSPTSAAQAAPAQVQPQEDTVTMGRPSASSQFGKGLAAQQSGDIERAIEHYKRALDANPGHFGAYNNLGVVYRQKGDYDQAISVLSEALALHPQDARVANNLAGCYIKRNQFGEAERVLRQAIAAAPNDLAAMTNLGIVYTAMGKYRDAEYYLSNAVQQHPQEARAYYNLGNLYRRLGRSEQAMRQYLRFLELSGGRHPQQEMQVRQMLGNTGTWGR